MRIALSGKSGAGKDFLARHLIENDGFIRLSFSDQLKRIAKFAFPWLKEDYPPIEKELPLNIVKKNGNEITMSPREIWLSFDFLRTIDEFVFIRGVEEEVQRLQDENLIITDIRTSEEFQFCRENGFVIINIKPKREIYQPNEFDNYASNTYTISDYVFENEFDGTEKFDSFIKGIFSENKTK